MDALEAMLQHSSQQVVVEFGSKGYSVRVEQADDLTVTVRDHTCHF